MLLYTLLEKSPTKRCYFLSLQQAFFAEISWLGLLPIFTGLVIEDFISTRFSASRDLVQRQYEKRITQLEISIT
jgi:hypothetical protein